MRATNWAGRGGWADIRGGRAINVLHEYIHVCRVKCIQSCERLGYFLFLLGLAAGVPLAFAYFRTLFRAVSNDV